LELRPGLVLGGKYHLLRHLGMGGMGDVWVARNASTGADVAVKMLLPERAASADSLERFRREAHATARLTHRAIVRVFDLIELDADQGSLLMVMELLRGHTVAEKIHQQTRLSVEDALDIVLPILSALDHAHGVGLVHRDLKPENIFIALEPDGQVMPKLLDFGISKMRHPFVDAITADGELVGTPCYMSPEQARGRGNVDARSDIFSVGTLLYEMLAGRNPFLADSLHAVVMAVLEADPAPIEDIPPALWDVIARALRKRADERYATTSELAQALRAAVPAYASPFKSGAPVRSPFRSMASSIPAVNARTTVAPLRMPDRRMGAAIVIAAGAILLLCGSFAGSLHAPYDGGESAREMRAERIAKVIVRDEGTTLAPEHRHGSIEANDASVSRAPMERAVIAAAVTTPESPMIAAASAAVPTASPKPQPLIRRPHRSVQVMRDPGF
jgi:serine/threonine protein kinase